MGIVHIVKAKILHHLSVSLCKWAHVQGFMLLSIWVIFDRSTLMPCASLFTFSTVFCGGCNFFLLDQHFLLHQNHNYHLTDFHWHYSMTRVVVKFIICYLLTSYVVVDFKSVVYWQVQSFKDGNFIGIPLHYNM